MSSSTCIHGSSCPTHPYADSAGCIPTDGSAVRKAHPVDVTSELEHLPLMLTVDEAAQLLRIGRNGAYSAVADGALPSVRIGRTIRIPRAALTDLLGNQRDRADMQAEARTKGETRR